MTINPYLRNVLAILAGLIVGGMVNGGLVSISGRIISPPAGVDVMDAESLKANIHLFGPKHFLMPFLAHALGTLAGAYTAARLVTKAPAFYGFIVGVFFLLGGLYMVRTMPGTPIWFILVDLVLAYLPMAMIGNVLAKRKRNDG